jgi:predicted deacylase
MLHLFSGRKVIAFISALIVLCGVIVFLTLHTKKIEPEPHHNTIITPTTTKETIGFSVEGRAIEAFTYGNGPALLLFVGGIHGGYEWNSVLLAYEIMQYLQKNPSVIPNSVSVAIIPSINPDGIFSVTKKEGSFTSTDVSPDTKTKELARFNARGVDLNRNFDCKWKPKSTWRGTPVSAGTAPFSEPETEALREYIKKHEPATVVFWHSQANAVYASECENGILPQTRAVMNEYAGASGYTAVDTFDAYEISGDAEGWLSSIGIPAITVELSSHESIDLERNISGVLSLMQMYSHQ